MYTQTHNVIHNVLLKQEYAKAVAPLQDKKNKYTENWNFIKMHYQTHAFQHVQEKGATRNFNTKINENMHKPLCDAYHQRTNFKDIEKQVAIGHQIWS